MITPNDLKDMCGYKYHRNEEEFCFDYDTHKSAFYVELRSGKKQYFNINRINHVLGIFNMLTSTNLERRFESSNYKWTNNGKKIKNVDYLLAILKAEFIATK